jgi:hypothetical protein
MPRRSQINSEGLLCGAEGPKEKRETDHRSDTARGLIADLLDDKTTSVKKGA